MGKLHVFHAQPEKSAHLGLQNAFHARKEHFLMKPLEVVSLVTTTYLGTKENATARWISQLVLTMQKLANANLILKTNLLIYYQDVNVLNSRVMLSRMLCCLKNTILVQKTSLECLLVKAAGISFRHAQINRI